MNNSLDFLNDPQPPRLPSTPPPLPQREGWTLLEYMAGVAVGFIAGLFLAWLLFAIAVNLGPGGEALAYLMYIAIPGLPIGVPIAMYKLGRRRF